MQDDAIIGFIPVREAIYGLARHDEEEGEQNKDKKAKEKKAKTIQVSEILAENTDCQLHRVCEAQ